MGTFILYWQAYRSHRFCPVFFCGIFCLNHLLGNLIWQAALPPGLLWRNSHTHFLSVSADVCICLFALSHLWSSSEFCWRLTCVYMSEWDRMNWLIIDVFPTWYWESRKQSQKLLQYGWYLCKEQLITSELPRNRILYVLILLSGNCWSERNMYKKKYVFWSFCIKLE